MEVERRRYVVMGLMAVVGAIFLTIDLKEYIRADLYEAYREEELESWILENITKEQEETLLRKYAKFGVFAPKYLRRELEGKPDYFSFKLFCRRKIRRT